MRWRRCCTLQCCTPPAIHGRFEANGEISGMVSVEGEVVLLTSRIRPAAANGAVEKWLMQVRADHNQRDARGWGWGLTAVPSGCHSTHCTLRCPPCFGYRRRWRQAW